MGDGGRAVRCSPRHLKLSFPALPLLNVRNEIFDDESGAAHYEQSKERSLWPSTAAAGYPIGLALFVKPAFKLKGISRRSLQEEEPRTRKRRHMCRYDCARGTWRTNSESTDVSGGCLKWASFINESPLEISETPPSRSIPGPRLLGCRASLCGLRQGVWLWSGEQVLLPRSSVEEEKRS